MCVLLMAAAGCTAAKVPAASSGASTTSARSTGPAPSTVIELPSQTQADAARDGVVPAVAALPIYRRIHAVGFAPVAEGVWVASRLPDATAADAPKGVLGDPTGRDGQTWVQASVYGELLLLNSTRTSILRAYPLPDVPPQRLLVRDDAVYAERQGAGRMPISMLCRVDRRTLAATVRLFPTSSAPVAQRPLPNWQVNAPVDKSLFTAINDYGSELWVSGADGEAQVEPITLALGPMVPSDPVQRALAGRVRDYLQANPKIAARLAGNLPVLCDVHVWGTSAPKREIYAEVLCGTFAAVNGVATQISAIATPIVLTTAGAPAASAITAFKMPGNDEQYGRDVRAWFPPSTADHILQGNPHLDERDLLSEAQTMLADGQLPVATAAP